jgi:photosystem II stability/assembly factor-like uncharacterized protein
VLALPGSASVYAFGLQGGVIFSQDFGNHWSTLQSGTDVVLAGAALDTRGELLLVGSVGTLLHVRGNRPGMPFSVPGRANLSAAIEAPDGAIVVVGQGGAQRLEAALGDE